MANFFSFFPKVFVFVGGKIEHLEKDLFLSEQPATKIGEYLTLLRGRERELCSIFKGRKSRNLIAGERSEEYVFWTPQRKQRSIWSLSNLISQLLPLFDVLLWNLQSNKTQLSLSVSHKDFSGNELNGGMKIFVYNFNFFFQEIYRKFHGYLRSLEKRGRNIWMFLSKSFHAC